MKNDPWHFRRDELAERVLDTLVRGPGQALSLFAPRRTGKTEFLLQDLAPAARAQGHRVAYASFWQAPLSPAATLLHALARSMKPATLRERLRASAARSAPKLTLKASIPGTGAGAEAEVDLAQPLAAPPSDLLLQLDDALERTTLGRPTPIILLLDEVQELASTRRNAPFVAALRTSLDKRRHAIRVVFTGSSRSGLAAMFSAREAPFFHFATPIDLPPLGEPFVDHVLAVFRKAARRRIGRDGMVEAFDHLHRNPYFFRILVQTMLHDPEHTVQSALEAAQDRIAVDLGYQDTWLALTPIQRGTVQALAGGESRPFGGAFRTALGEALGEQPPSPSRVQAALRKLERLGVVDRIGGRWELADPAFAGWVGGGGEGDY